MPTEDVLGDESYREAAFKFRVTDVACGPFRFQKLFFYHRSREDESVH